MMDSNTLLYGDFPNRKSLKVAFEVTHQLIILLEKVRSAYPLLSTHTGFHATIANGALAQLLLTTNI
jgi:hypothetical protein